MCWATEPKQEMTHCPNTFRLHWIQTLHPHSFRHTFSLTPFSSVEPDSTVKAGGTWAPHGIPHRTCRLSHSSGSFTVVLCGVNYKWHREEKEEEVRGRDRLLAAEQVGMQLLLGLVRQWMSGRGEGVRGRSPAALLHLERRSQKWQKWCHSHRHTQAGTLYPFHQQNDEEGEVMQTCIKERRLYLKDICLGLHHQCAYLAILDKECTANAQAS